MKLFTILFIIISVIVMILAIISSVRKSRIKDKEIKRLEEIVKRLKDESENQP